MFTKVSSFSEIDLEKYGSFRLCYIDRIEEEIYNYPNSSDLRFSYQQTWIPNPEYIEGETDHYAFFTPVFDKQWGDDWNDAPYEHNAGEPYDSVTLSTKEVNGIKFVDEVADVNILVVRFALNSYNSSFPRDYDPCNSPFSVEMINAGAVAWIYDCKYVNRGKKKHVAIQAGVNPYEFAEKINQIKENNKDDWKPYDDED